MIDEKSYTKGGAMQTVSLDVLCDFVIKARGQWSNPSKKCEISNVTHGTEDDLLWDTVEEVEIDLLSTE